jgi:hypothetical protein
MMHNQLYDVAFLDFRFERLNGMEFKVKQFKISCHSNQCFEPHTKLLTHFSHYAGYCVESFRLRQGYVPYFNILLEDSIPTIP